MPGECLRTAIGTVASDDDDPVYSMFSADIGTLLLTLRCLEFKAPRSSQDGSASLDDIRYITGLHIINFLI